MAKKPKRLRPILLDVPFSADPPILTEASVGLSRIVRRTASSYTMDVTVLDAVDGRLLRDGVTVAHRVVGGLGQWYLAAPRWQPELPAEAVEPLGGSGDLPRRIVDLIRPLLRGTPLGPIAALTCERGEWALRAEDGQTVALVRDDRVTVRRSGMITARYREITVTPTQHCAPAQLAFLRLVGATVNATTVTTFPEIQQRLGAPATGLTNFPAPRALERGATLEEFVSGVFAEHLNRIVRTDLHRRATDPTSVTELNTELSAFWKDLRGLASVLEPSWRESTESLLSGLPFEGAAEAELPTLQVIDALVGAARAPRLGDLAPAPAGNLLFERAEKAAAILGDRCRALGPDSPDSAWQAALSAAEQLVRLAGVASPLLPKVNTLVEPLERIVVELGQCVHTDVAPDFATLTPEEAFQLGAESQRASTQVRKLRRALLKRWPDRVEEGRALLARARKRLR